MLPIPCTMDKGEMIEARAAGAAVPTVEDAEVRALLAAIVDSSDDAIVSKSLDGVVTSWNKSAERLFGYTAEEAIGRPIADLIIPPDRKDEEPRILERLRRGDRMDHFETVRVRKDGTTLIVSLTISPVKDPSGRIVGASKVARDITEQKRAQEQLRRLNEDLEQRVADRTAELLQTVEQLKGFTYSIAHDLRQSIRGIVTNSQMILEDHGDKLDEEGRGSLGRLAAHGKKMSQLVDDLLKYARVGDHEPRRELVDVTAMARDVAEDLHGRNGEAEVSIEDGLRAVADPAQLRLVFENLLDNAFKYRREGLPLSVAVGRANGALFVRDNGVGFEQKYAARIFQPFERLDASRFEGTGIGLANAKRVVEKHGGRIWAESAPNEGAAFFFTLGEE